MVVGAGNIARCDGQNDEQTALVLDAIAGTVFTTGDNIHASGSLSDFQNCYGPSWGRHAARTRPAPGDDDYKTAGAAGYFGYFGPAAGEAGKGYYSYDLGAWHIVVLNSNISMVAGSAQETWLRADLAATTQPCVLAYWHHPRFSSYGTAVRSEVKPLWDALYAAQADVVLNGHYRLYERFGLQTPAGLADAAAGIRQFTVGTGGHGVHTFGTPRPNSEVRASGTYGVLELTLDAGSYSWDFVPITGQTFTDTGTGTCHGRPGGPPPPNQAPSATPGGSYQAEATVTFDGSGSRDPDNNLPLTYAWDFGDETTGVGVTPEKTYGANGTYTVTLVVTDGLGLASAPATTTVAIGNLPPGVNAGADATVQLGSAFVLNATFTDPGGAGDGPWAWIIDWGDGTPTESGSTSTLGGPIRTSHTFTAYGQYTVRLTVTDKDGGAGSDQTVVTVPDPGAAVVLVGAGDIAGCYQDNDEQTAILLDAIPGIVFTTGDNAYGQGTPEDYANCYHPTWGRHKARTRPSPGNHDYGSMGAPGYFGYFGAAAGDPDKGYYSYTAGEWLVLVLNSSSGSDARDAASPQVQWLRAELAATTKPCALAYMHHPQFTSTADRRSGQWNVIDLWNALYDGGVELVLAGHDHLYERFAPMRPDGTFDPEFGIRQITVGTGGEGLNKFGTIHPNSVARSNVAFGVLKLTLSADGYAWEFVPIAGQTYFDGGTGTCHGRLAGEPPNQAPTVNAGADAYLQLGAPFNLSATFTDPSGAADAPWTWSIAWGDGASDNGSTPTLGGPITASNTYGTPGQYTVRVTVTDQNGGAGADETVVTVTDAVSLVLVGAGNIARCDGQNDEQTALLLDAISGTVFTTGDNVYAGGALTDFQNCYGPSWGRHAARTRPAPGDEDYRTAGGAGYFSYFRPTAGDPAQGYHSYDLGAWHIVVLNSNISMVAGSAQELWLWADLAATTQPCVLAYWHHPRFSSYGTAVRSEVKPLWDALYAAGADVVLNAHYRVYERFAPQTPTGGADPTRGIRQFTVGTGGQGVNTFGTPRPNSEVRASGTYGVLKLTLDAGSYSWQFVPIAGQTFTDAGTTPCH
ncbi:MAG: PKD domain-containing protein [Gemmatimonadales bacterium]